MPFRDRADAGEQLGQRLRHLKGNAVLVLGLARGGVPVAAEVARALDAPLDVFVSRKLGAPGNPEYGIGAVAPGVLVLDESAARAMGVSPADAEVFARAERREMERRLYAYRGTAQSPDVRGRRVILVDDGLATGVTARAALRSLRASGAAHLLLAVPVAAADSLESLQSEADDLVALEAPLDLQAVGLWYDDFRPVEDSEVMALLGPRHIDVVIPLAGGPLAGDLVIPWGASGVVVFAHGSGSGRASPRNRNVARQFQARGLATLLIDLVRDDEGDLRFDIDVLSLRVCLAIDALRDDPDTRDLPVGLFGSSTGAAAALVAAARRPERVAAVVSRGGRPDLASDTLADVAAPTLLLVGGADVEVLALNEQAYVALSGQAVLEVIPGATHLFGEPGALERVAQLSARWFLDHFGARTVPRRPGSAHPLP